MPTFTAFTTVTDKDRAEALSEALERLETAPEGVGLFEVEDGSGEFEVAGYFADPPDRAGLALLATIHGARDFVVSHVPDTDWVAHVQRTLRPVEAGRFFVYGSHDADKIPDGRIALLIEAAMAFGTGHHATTLGCLRALDRMAERGRQVMRVADIGCGTAVLAMAAAHLWPDAAVLASDNDPQAVETGAANIAANGLGSRVACLLADGLDHPDLEAGEFDLLFANILKGPLIQLAPAIARANRVGGLLVLSGILNQQVEEVLEHYLAQGYSLAEREEIVDWTTLVLGRTASSV